MFPSKALNGFNLKYHSSMRWSNSSSVAQPHNYVWWVRLENCDITMAIKTAKYTNEDGQQKPKESILLLFVISELKCYPFDRITIQCTSLWKQFSDCFGLLSDNNKWFFSLEKTLRNEAILSKYDWQRNMECMADKNERKKESAEKPTVSERRIAAWFFDFLLWLVWA